VRHCIKIYSPVFLPIYKIELRIFFFLRFFIYLFGRDIAREGTQAGGAGEGEAGFLMSMEPDAGRQPRTKDRGIMTWAEGRHLATEPPRCPSTYWSSKFFFNLLLIFFSRYSICYTIYAIPIGLDLNYSFFNSVSLYNWESQFLFPCMFRRWSLETPITQPNLTSRMKFHIFAGLTSELETLILIK